MTRVLQWGIVGLLIVGGIVVSTLFRGGECSATITGTPHVFVVSAFALERDALLEHVTVTDTCLDGGITYYVVEHADVSFVLYMSGMGPEEARASTAHTLEHFTVSKLVFAGIAGAIDTTLHAGDTVVAHAWMDHATGETLVLDEAIVAAALQVPDVESVAMGVTADHVVRDISEMPEHVSIVDMESYSVGVVAHAYGVPFVAFRSVSDFADGDMHADTMRAAAEASAIAALAFVGTL